MSEKTTGTEVPTMVRNRNLPPVEQEKASSDWRVRLGLFTTGLVTALGGAAGLYNYLNQEITAGGSEFIPVVGGALTLTGIILIGSSLLPEGNSGK